MKIKLLILVSFTIFINASAQIGFQNHVIIDEMDALLNPTYVKSADIDGDGDLDVLISTDYKIGWYENTNIKNDFKPIQIIVSNTSVRTIDYGDLDGDNDIDIIASINQSIVWYENIDGKGSFSTGKIISQNSSNSIYITDIDGDGDFDVLSDSSSLEWHENIDGQGNFSLPYLINSQATFPSPIFPSDIDGDGDIDIIFTTTSVTRETDRVAWLENLDGRGSFSSEKLIAYNNQGIRSIYASDIDGDNDMDVLLGSLYNDSLVWYENTNGFGVFSTEKVINSNIQDGGVFQVNDVDSDGDNDVVYADAVTGIIAWQENTNGQGDFSKSKTIFYYNRTFSNHNGPKFIYPTDLDNDGDIDVISLFRLFATGEIAWHENDGNESFGEKKPISGNLRAIKSIYSGDIDGDGYIDVISGGLDLGWFKNINGQGIFGSKKIIENSTTNSIRSVLTIDVDNDNDLDVISGHYEKIVWYENLDGLGTFSEETNITTDVDGVESIYAIDIDNDNDIDILSASGSGNDHKIAWYENTDGQGTFGDQKIVTTAIYGIKSIYAIDIDNDGDIDILSASSWDNKIAWYENTDGLGDFGNQKIISTNLNSPTYVSAADLNGNGNIDILATSDNDDKIVWYENTDGQGSFGNQQIITSSVDNPKIVMAKDIDKDGDLDIISGSSKDNKIAWYENTDGLANFGLQQIISSDARDIKSIHINDLDRDGDLDIISASLIIGDINGDNKIVWYENSGHIRNEINGFIRLDIDSNGCDVNNPSTANFKVTTSDGVNELSTFPLKNGFYQLFPEEGNFTTQITSTLPNYYDYSPTAYTSNFTGIGNTDSFDFCLVPNQTINDLNITLLPTSQARPGFDASYQLVFHNIGTTQLNGSIVLEFANSKLTYLTSSETVTSQDANSLTLNYSNLNPFEIRSINMKFNVIAPPDTEIGDILTFTATINPISGDYTENDNIFNLNQTVIGSYDPNDIRVLEGEQVLIEDADEYLHYIIRFQNTGTADAINVRVDNILDPNLDWNTIQLESSSHSNRVEIKDGNEVSFIFNGIYLPDSTTDEPNSHGFIAYKIKPKDTIDIGDVMQNKADIFFDFNLPIITNTVSTKIVETLSVNENKLSSFQMYPNPTTGIFNIKSKSKISEIQIYNNLGQIVVYQTDKTTIDISLLNAGLYFIKIKDKIGNSEIKKIIKE